MCSLSMVNVFFFKQKTAYEMRISDWSSDVCSSDLLHILECGQDCPQDAPCSRGRRQDSSGILRSGAATRRQGRTAHAEGLYSRQPSSQRFRHGPQSRKCSRRSEEHTSELQSLMRISYAVFCLKKKK